jgi:hypothetical protein
VTQPAEQQPNRRLQRVHERLARVTTDDNRAVIASLAQHLDTGRLEPIVAEQLVSDPAHLTPAALDHALELSNRMAEHRESSADFIAKFAETAAEDRRGDG